MTEAKKATLIDAMAGDLGRNLGLRPGEVAQVITESLFGAIEPLIDEAKLAAWRAGRDAAAQGQTRLVADYIHLLEPPEYL